MIFKIKDLLTILDNRKITYKFYGDEELELKGFSPINDYKSRTVTWIKNDNYIDGLNKNFDFVISSFNNPVFLNVLITNQPKIVFFKLLDCFYSEELDNQIISARAIISEDAKVGKNVSIGDFTIVEQGATIGDNTIIESNVYIGKNVFIGNNCLIQSGVTIGSDGFGFIKSNGGMYVREKHIGEIIIKDNVDIGNNTCIARATLGATVINEGTKIDTLCHIAHNVHIGKNNLIITGSYLYGSVVTGDDCYIASSIIRNKVKLGNNVMVGMGSVVTKDVIDNITVFGCPAKEYNKRG